MRLNFLGKKSIASAIIVGTLKSIQVFSFIRLGLKISDEDIWKLYYEFDKLFERMKVKQYLEKIDEEEFLKFITEFVESIDKEWAKNPTFMENKKIFWDIFVYIKKYLNEDMMKNPLMNEINFQINQNIIQNEEVLNYKIKRDVDFAIQDYEKEVPKNLNETQPIYSEKPPDESVAQSLLGGEMRLTAPWAVKKETDS